MGLCQFDTVFLRPSYKIIINHKYGSFRLSHAPHNTDGGLASDQHVSWSLLFRPCVLFEAAVYSSQLLKGRRSFSTFKRFCWCFCSDSKLEFCRDDGSGFPLPNQSTCILLFHTPNEQPRVKSTLLCAHL